MKRRNEGKLTLTYSKKLNTVKRNTVRYEFSTPELIITPTLILNKESYLFSTFGILFYRFEGCFKKHHLTGPQLEEDVVNLTSVFEHNSPIGKSNFFDMETFLAKLKNMELVIITPENFIRLICKEVRFPNHHENFGQEDIQRRILNFVKFCTEKYLYGSERNYIYSVVRFFFCTGSDWIFKVIWSFINDSKGILDIARFNEAKTISKCFYIALMPYIYNHNISKNSLCGVEPPYLFQICATLSLRVNETQTTKNYNRVGKLHLSESTPVGLVSRLTNYMTSGFALGFFNSQQLLLDDFDYRQLKFVAGVHLSNIGIKVSPLCEIMQICLPRLLMNDIRHQPVDYFIPKIENPGTITTLLISSDIKWKTKVEFDDIIGCLYNRRYFENPLEYIHIQWHSAIDLSRYVSFDQVQMEMISTSLKHLKIESLEPNYQLDTKPTTSFLQNFYAIETLSLSDVYFAPEFEIYFKNFAKTLQSLHIRGYMELNASQKVPMFDITNGFSNLGSLSVEQTNRQPINLIFAAKSKHIIKIYEDKSQTIHFRFAADITFVREKLKQYGASFPQTVAKLNFQLQNEINPEFFERCIKERYNINQTLGTGFWNLLNIESNNQQLPLNVTIVKTNWLPGNFLKFPIAKLSRIATTQLIKIHFCLDLFSFEEFYVMVTLFLEQSGLNGFIDLVDNFKPLVMHEEALKNVFDTGHTNTCFFVWNQLKFLSLDHFAFWLKKFDLEPCSKTKANISFFVLKAWGFFETNNNNEEQVKNLLDFFETEKQYQSIFIQLIDQGQKNPDTYKLHFNISLRDLRKTLFFNITQWFIINNTDKTYVILEDFFNYLNLGDVVYEKPQASKFSTIIRNFNLEELKLSSVTKSILSALFFGCLNFLGSFKSPLLNPILPEEAYILAGCFVLTKKFAQASAILPDQIFTYQTESYTSGLFQTLHFFMNDQEILKILPEKLVAFYVEYIQNHSSNKKIVV